MKNTYGLKKYVKRQYVRLQTAYESELGENDGFLWLKDNRNRILNICSSLVRDVPVIKLPVGYKDVRVLELARELTNQTLGNINEETILLSEQFNLTNDEFSFLPTALKISLIDMILKILEDRILIENTPSAVKSLILFSDIDFELLREKCLKQENFLLKDAVFCSSDEATRERYRKRITLLSKKSSISEAEVCNRALNEGFCNITKNLFLDGRELFEQTLGIKVKNRSINLRLFCYVFSIMLLTASSIGIWWIVPVKAFYKVLLSIFSFAPTVVFFCNIINRTILRKIRPEKPMRLKPEFADIHQNKTAIVLTVMLSGKDDIKNALKSIEEYFLGNRLKNGVYLVLGDLSENDFQNHAEDDILRDSLEKGIKELNNRHGNYFGAIVRNRQKNGEKFSGWERKRGAIEQFVRFLTKNEDIFGTFINKEIFYEVKYICTLDADTVLPPDSVIKLLGVIAHPINKLRIENDRVWGYGLVQPMIGTLPVNHTPFARIMAPTGGIDAYDAPMGEVYNDYFKSGSFCGKGIFDVEGYEKLVKIQPNTVLSHDMLEGELLNTIGANDVSFLDEFPQNTISYYKRKERWMRGDWILTPWLFSKIKPISKWKIFYNLVQSEFFSGIFLKCLLAPFFGAYGYLIWICALIELSMPTIFAYCDMLRFDMEKHAFSDNKHNRRNSIKRSVLNKVFLPFECYLGISAKFKGLWRRFVSHKKVLEWSTFASTRVSGNMKENVLFFLPSIILAVIFYSICLWQGIGIVVGLIASGIWCFVPYFAKILSQKENTIREELLPDEVHSLKILAMRTLRFFYEALSDNGYLMPDNIQLKPYKGYAKRTSPTNLGFALLSVPCGLKMGAYSPSFSVSNLNKQIEEISKLSMMKGHLYNWYDIDTRKPLSEYVSTVDSGNFCASLVTVKGSLEAIKKRQILGKAQCNGIGDMIFSYLDSVSDDFQRHLKEYACDFYAYVGKKSAKRIKDFLADGIISSCEGIEFVQDTLKSWLTDYENLSFSDSLFNKIEKTNEFNLRPLKEYLQTFPKSISDTLAICDFDCIVEERVWSLGREKYGWLLKDVRNEFRRIYNYAFALNEQISKIDKYIDEFLENADFKCLYNSKKKLFAIGMDKNGQSANCYDMLVSEARLTSFFAIAYGKIPAEHWFRLARPFTRVMETPLCLSWSGTMFEYLMPDIFIKPTENSMLYNSNNVAVKAQIEYSKSGMWGISESAFNAFDVSREYKYKAFGIPQTAISVQKLEKVYSPYSTMMAFEYAPRQAMDNVIRFVENGCAGIFGMFEAVDMKRLSGGQPGIVYSHMAHHSGMGLCGLVNYLYNGAIRKMFISNSFISANTVLLEEKMPLGVLPRKELEEQEQNEVSDFSVFEREFIAPDKQSEELNVISGGDVRIEVTSRGEAKLFFSKKYIGEIFLYVRDEKTRSISYLPVKDDKVKYKTVFYPEKGIFYSNDALMDCKAEVYALENSNEALWRIKIKNKTEYLRKKQILFFLKPALNNQDAFDSHPYYNGLFIEAEHKEKELEFKNRKTDTKCLLSVVGECEVTYETDALKALGRGNDFDRPIGIFDGEIKKYPITPLMCCMAEMELDVMEENEVNIVLSMAERSTLKNKAAVNLAAENARISANADIAAFNIKKEEWLLSLKIGEMKNAMCCAEKGCASPETLWQYGISDNVPLMTLLLSKDFSKEKLKFILKTADYLMSKNFNMQVLIIEDTVSDYLDSSYNYTDREIKSLISKDRIYHIKRGNIIEEKIKEIKRMSFCALSLESDINEQIKKVKPYVQYAEIKTGENKYPLGKNEDYFGEFDNGYGKFINGGKEYYIYKKTPMPWSNVICNNTFGTLVTENGGGYTWQGNSSLNKLSPWYNDAVTNPLGEALYLRDNKINRFWSITRDPIDMGDEHSVIFGKGYATFRYNGYGMEQKQTVFVHKEKNIKIIRVELDNISERDISAYYFIRPVMGQHQNKSSKYTEIVNVDGLIAAKKQNEYMFIYAKDAEFCGSEDAFFGNGDIKMPRAVYCGEFLESTDSKELLALKTKAKKHFDIFVGYAFSEEELRNIKKELDDADTLLWLDEVKSLWEERTNRIQITTPDRKLDILFNNWLYYQTMASRIMARCGFYQAGGAYGFRDQLQDCLAVMITEPELVRTHILKCAAHQFKEGDVQHWWHEPYMGVRTKVSDDLLFLPYVASKYVSVTGDIKIFDEKVPFLEGHELGDREDLYENAWQSKEEATLYEHCMRAIRLAISRSGKHGLPLILGGDWNDGMNGIGKQGIGESVWLGWFLYSVISDFMPIVKKINIKDSVILLENAKKLYNALNTVCWDGEWYLRAFNDKGEKIGSRTSACAQIDLISQAWSVLSGAGKSHMIKSAMDNAEKYLFDRETGIVKLLNPPFSKEFGAGYIGDYIPGVRENGGQYTHGALWAARAFFEMGRSDTGYEILSMINPINHSLNKSAALRYKLEPYSIPADIYSNVENKGRGGWSWYTASSSLYFTTVLSSFLGIDMNDGKIRVSPHIPSNWREFNVTIDTPRYKYDVKVLNPQGRSDSVENITEVDKGDKKEIRVVM